MFFRRRIPVLPNEPVAAFVHQLSDEELKQQERFDISHVGAVLDINKIDKEETLMVEKLKVYLAELMAKKDALINEDHTAEIEAEVVAYRETLTKGVEAKKAEAIAKVDSDIECITAIIARETAAENEAVEATENTVTE